MSKNFLIPTLGRKNSFSFLPADLVKNFAEYTGRAQRSDAAIEEMAKSLLQEGQVVDVLFRRGDQGEVVPVTGHTRILAARLINERGLTGKVNGKDVTFGEENPFVITGRFKNMTPAEGVIYTFVENDPQTRTPPTDYDMALAISMLEDTYGMSVTAIAERLGRQITEISRMKRVLTLDGETLEELKDGTLNLSEAVAAAQVIDPAVRREAIANARANGTGGRATAAGILAAASNAGAAIKGSQSMSLAGFMKVLKPLADSPVESGTKVNALALWDLLKGRGSLTLEEILTPSPSAVVAPEVTVPGAVAEIERVPEVVMEASA